MRQLLLLSVLSVAVPTSVALACDDPNCDGKHCDMPGSTTKAAIPAGSTAVNLKVDGMMCGECAGKVQTALMAVPGVTVANVDVSTGTAEVGYDAKKTNVDALLAAVNATEHFKATKL